MGVIKGFVQLIPRSYKSDKFVNIAGIDKVHSKCDCINESNVNGIREPIFFSFGLSSPPGHKICKGSRINLFERVNKPVLSHIRFYLEDDDHEAENFNGEAVGFTCQLIK